MKKHECKHLKRKSKEDKYPNILEKYEHPINKLICGICNTFFKYKKKNPCKIKYKGGKK